MASTILPRPAANITPPEILLQIFYLLSPRDFDNARRTCSQWMRVSLDKDLLESMLKRAGWWDAWKQDCDIYRVDSSASEQSLVWRMSRRFATECILSGRKSNVERAGFLTTGVVDFSRLSQGQSLLKQRVSAPHAAAGTVMDLDSKPLATSKFHVSNCANYLLVTSGRIIYVYHLLSRKSGSVVPTTMDALTDLDIAPVTSIICPVEVISASIDTSTSKIGIAALLRDRLGFVCDLNASNERASTRLEAMQSLDPSFIHYFRNICSPEDPPRSVSICPGRRCVAFGSGAGIELHWVDEKTKQNQRKRFSMSQPSEILHFLPHRPETPMEMRLISSLAGPGMPGCQCHKASLSVVRATHCHHYRAISINDGLHILFIEPRTGLLCIGSDAPIGGPTSLTRALVCVPPFEKDSLNVSKDDLAPTVFASGWNLDWGLRVVAAYGDRIVLYSVPVDVYNVIRKERERQGDGVMGDSDLARDFFLDNSWSGKRRESLVQDQSGDWEFLLSVSWRPTVMMWPFKIYGKEIARMENVVELALQSASGGARIWAFGANGETNIIDIDTFSLSNQQSSSIPCKSLTIDADGNIASAQWVDRTDSGLLTSQSSRKRKSSDSREDFGGQQSAICRLPRFLHEGYVPTNNVLPPAFLGPAARRPSFAACIVDFKIPELGQREGAWVDGACA
ncbi:hypothetical protein IFM46972_04344 [Aspergillus udagawae]|uniref:F-box domain-containing protein n=1 Tax=Aspergillus udagawae TaxID=91492 RepID=A0A8H3NMV2_9EURO|nr:hypothetical protein IFM46972_04344 [Aspergillus udagawae]